MVNANRETIPKSFLGLRGRAGRVTRTGKKVFRAVSTIADCKIPGSTVIMGFEDIQSKGKVSLLSFPAAAAASEMQPSHSRYIGVRKYDAAVHQDNFQSYRGIVGPHDMDNRFGSSFDTPHAHEWEGRMFRDSDVSGHFRKYSSKSGSAI
jgi:hypothetical protein